MSRFIENFFRIGFIIAVPSAIILLKKIKEKSLSGEISQEPLTKDEKNKVWILALLNPVWTGAILYFGLKKRFPVKAKNVNTISWKALFILFIIGAILWVLGLVQIK
jgi:hypothetical protein